MKADLSMKMGNWSTNRAIDSDIPIFLSNRNEYDWLIKLISSEGLL